MKHCILEDSSFVIAVIDKNDRFHRDGWLIMQELYQHRDLIKILLPSHVLLETTRVLAQKMNDYSLVEEKINKLIHLDYILPISIADYSVFRFYKRIPMKETLKTTDLFIALEGIEYDAQILTFDRQMKEHIGKFYKKIYYCSNRGKKGEYADDETMSFFEDLGNFIGKDIVGKYTPTSY